jgi:hypothetical protein
MQVELSGAVLLDFESVALWLVKTNVGRNVRMKGMNNLGVSLQ